MLLDSFQAKAQNNVQPMAVGKLPVPQPAALELSTFTSFEAQEVGPPKRW